MSLFGLLLSRKSMCGDCTVSTAVLHVVAPLTTNYVYFISANRFPGHARMFKIYSLVNIRSTFIFVFYVTVE